MKDGKLLNDIRNFLFDEITDGCFETSCDCEGNEKYKTLMDRIESEIEKQGEREKTERRI